MDPWYLKNLVCPVDHHPLEFSDGVLISSAGRKYPVVQGVPVMLLAEAEQTIGVASASLERAKGECVGDARAPELHLESLGIGEKEKEGLIELAARDDLRIDPVVAYIVGATNGYAYKHLIGNLDSYPIPDLRLPEAKGETFLELGCNWGRWCIAAARKGYTVVGIDPSLGAILAAQRVAHQLNLPIMYLVGDARYLPFKSPCFDTIFSYSVLQHLSKSNVNEVLGQVSRILKPGGTSFIQMPNFLGIRCLQHQVKRRFRKARDFEVRYWSISELQKTFGDKIGRTEVSVDCYFGLGLQKKDEDLMPPKLKFIVGLSEFLRSLSHKIRIIKYIADSVYVKSIRSNDMKKAK
jgi:SAM-dependent methyltransferase/uncharacterized protein YbaR (Trm112 family)